MKRKRILCFIMLLFLGIVISSASALAFANKTISSDAVDISLYASISYVPHNLIFPDNVSFYASATGSDTYMLIYSATDVKVYVKPGTDSAEKDTYYLTYPNALERSVSNLSCDRKGTYGILKMHCVDKNATIISYD